MQSATELRVLQNQVVEGLVAASMVRIAATGRGFQDTGSTMKAFEGEEVDWYICNVASYHVKQSMDPSLPLVANEDVKRLLLTDDETIVRAAAVAVGMAELELLLEHCIAAEEWIEAAKVAWVVGMVSGGSDDNTRHGKAALDLLAKAESVTTAVQQLELNMRGTLVFNMRTGPDKKQTVGRMQELMARNSSLRMDPLGQYMISVLPRLMALFGAHPRMWDAGKIATADTIVEGFRVTIYEGIPLCTKAVEESVGARKECIRTGYELIYCIPFLMMNRSTDETAEMHQQLLDEKWGRDGSILVAACMKYSFDRHHAIAKGAGSRVDGFMSRALGQAVAEHCGDMQQMVQLFDKQLGAMREYARSSVVGIDVGWYCMYVPGSFVGLELKVLHPFGKGLMALLAAWQCADPSECKEWYESAAWAAWRAQYGEGLSSKDGLHHLFPKPTIISGLQAVLSLSLASAGTSNFNLSWLDDLPAADDPKLHDCTRAINALVNPRVLIAEVLEQQGRHKEAIRCAILSILACVYISNARSHTSCCSIAALQQPTYKTASTSPLCRRCVQAGCSADATLHSESMPSQYLHSMRLSNWRGAGATCWQRR
jgi:hypothetical protein